MVPPTSLAPAQKETDVKGSAQAVANWAQIADILSTTQNRRFQPKRVDGDPLLPSAFSKVIKVRHQAQTKSLSLSLFPSSSPSPSLIIPSAAAAAETTKRTAEIPSPKLVRETLRALHVLRDHYDRLLARPALLRDALAGFDDHAVAWVEPQAQPAFSAFVAALCTRAAADAPTHDVAGLVDWAMRPNIDADLLHAHVDSSAAAFSSIEHAFHTFQLALDDMLDLHRTSRPQQ